MAPTKKFSKKSDASNSGTSSKYGKLWQLFYFYLDESRREQMVP